MGGIPLDDDDVGREDAVDEEEEDEEEEEEEDDGDGDGEGDDIFRAPNCAFTECPTKKQG